VAENKYSHRKFPQFQQNDIFSLADAFRKLDVDDKGYIDEATAIKATQASEHKPYDVVRQALKEVELDSSRRVELEDCIGVRRNCSAILFDQAKHLSSAPLLPPDTRYSSLW
jgi:hypothetical protein